MQRVGGRQSAVKSLLPGWLGFLSGLLCCLAAVARGEAQDCSVPTAAPTYGLLPDAVAFDTSNSDETPEGGVDVSAALKPWQEKCSASGTLPAITVAANAGLPAGVETWVVLRGNYDRFGAEGRAARAASACAGTYPDRRILIFEDAVGDACKKPRHTKVTASDCGAVKREREIERSSPHCQAAATVATARTRAAARTRTRTARPIRRIFAASRTAL